MADISSITLPDSGGTYNFKDAEARAGISGTLTTTAQTIVGAINEHEGDIITINTTLATFKNLATLEYEVVS